MSASAGRGDFVGAQGTPRERPEARYGEAEEGRGYGWVVFAGVMITLAGIMNMIYGIAAIAESHFYIANTHYVFSDLNTWGWIVMFIGAFQICAGVGIWMRARWARWVGVFIAGVNAIAQLLFLPAYPFLSLAIFTLDILVIYGLVAYGGKLEET